jgi:hypothetical protein
MNRSFSRRLRLSALHRFRHMPKPVSHLNTAWATATTASAAEDAARAQGISEATIARAKQCPRR